MHLAWDYLHMVADNGNVALLELRERIYNTGSAEIPQDAAPPVLPYQQESIVAQALPAGDYLLPKPPCQPVMHMWIFMQGLLPMHGQCMAPIGGGM